MTYFKQPVGKKFFEHVFERCACINVNKLTSQN